MNFSAIFVISKENGSIVVLLHILSAEKSLLVIGLLCIYVNTDDPHKLFSTTTSLKTLDQISHE